MELHQDKLQQPCSGTLMASQYVAKLSFFLLCTYVCVCVTLLWVGL